MRTRNFLVPQDLIFEFVEAIEENDFTNHIVETTAESEIEISIDYDTNQRRVVNQPRDMIDEHNYEEDDEDEEEQDLKGKDREILGLSSLVAPIGIEPIS